MLRLWDRERACKLFVIAESWAQQNILETSFSFLDPVVLLDRVNVENINSRPKKTLSNRVQDHSEADAVFEPIMSEDVENLGSVESIVKVEPEEFQTITEDDVLEPTASISDPDDFLEVINTETATFATIDTLATLVRQGNDGLKPTDPHACFVCHKVLSNRSGLKGHMKTFHCGITREKRKESRPRKKIQSAYASNVEANAFSQRAMTRNIFDSMEPMEETSLDSGIKKEPEEFKPSSIDESLKSNAST